MERFRRTQEPLPTTHGLESLPAMAREIFCNYPAETQKEIDDVIEWFFACINVEIYKAEAAQPIAPRSTTEESSAVKVLATTGIDSPFNACMYQEQCKRWRDASVRQPLTNDEIENCAELIGSGSMSLGEAFVRFARAIEAAHGITAPKPLWLPADDTEGGAT